MRTKAKPKNHIAIVLDRSGSMNAIRQETVRELNSRLETIRSQSEQADQETTLTLVTFSNRARVEFFNADVRTLRPLTTADFIPDGMTALFDGIGLAIETLAAAPDAEKANVSFLVMVLTDGDENISSNHTARDIAFQFKEKQKTDRWSFAIQVPPGRKASFCRDTGISGDNVHEWERLEQAREANAQGLSSYFCARSQGKRSVPAFYVTSDLSKVTSTKVKKKLEDLSSRFKSFEVPREVSIKQFVEEKTNRPYVVGSAYYQLTKTEKVQPKKSVLIVEKGKKTVWGGEEARELIGLPDGAVAQVTPGNHAGFDIFIASTSVNRKLVRGTRVLVDITKNKDDTPTWDHTAATKK